VSNTNVVLIIFYLKIEKPIDYIMAQTNGKLLEYAVYNLIKRWLSKYQDVSYDSRDEDYGVKWKNLDQTNKDDYTKFAQICCRHFQSLGFIRSIDQLYWANDADGVIGKVSDIVIGKLALSIKNNACYAKSQRPSAFATQLGLDSYDSEFYNIGYDAISSQPFQDYGATLCSNIEYTKELYDEIYCLMMIYLVKATSFQIRKLFRFLAGEPHFQAINKKDCVIIYDLRNRKNPTNMVVYRDSRGYIILEFNNGWNFSWRLHTAAKQISKKLSIKIDTKFINQDSIVPFKIINKL
jgi:hypothetical protein